MHAALWQLPEQEITCREIVGAHYRQVITCIKVYDGICASHLDIQVAEVIDVSRAKAVRSMISRPCSKWAVSWPF